MRAASGSTQMLNSAAGVTLPSQQGAPPMMMQRLTESASRGSRDKARAIFVSGPSVTISMPGFSRTASSRASTACLAPRGAAWAHIRDPLSHPLRETNPRRPACVAAAFPRRSRWAHRNRRVRRCRARCWWPAVRNVSGDDSNRCDADFLRAQGHDQSYGVVRSGVRVDQQSSGLVNFASHWGKKIAPLSLAALIRA